MGYYINHDSKGSLLNHKTKVEELLAAGDAVLTNPSKSFADIPEGKALLCCVHMPFFDAVGYAFDEKELSIFQDREDTRPKTWMYMDKDLCHKLTGYKP